jgi:HSP20 family protein
MNTTLQKEPRTETQPVRVEYVTPPVNIYETKTDYVLEAEMPGVNKDGLDVTLEGNEITIHGRRAPETTAGEPLLRERYPTTEFRRVFEIDPALDTGKISAKVEQGLLTLVLPKSSRQQPRRIAVAD